MSSHVPENQGCNVQFSKIFTCLFFRKKTVVVQVKKEEPVVEKKKMLVDRSEHSQSVLKMESLKAAPKSKINDTNAELWCFNHMFLPSENPSASFLSTLTPSVRRTCSEVIRATNAPSNHLSREAFTASERRIPTRNTSYRGQHAAEKLRPNKKKKGSDELGKPLKKVERNNTIPRVGRKPIVVPGITTCSNNEIGPDSREYDTESEVMDLHEEMRQLNLSSHDMQSATKSKQLATNTRHRINHGEVSISEINEIDGEEEAVVNIPHVLSSVLTHEGTDLVRCFRKDNTLENDDQQSARPVINNGFTQTQNNDNVVLTSNTNSMDIETCRSDTGSPDTCIRHLKHEFSVGRKFRNIQIINSSTTNMNHRQTNGILPEISSTNVPNKDINLDSLFAEVSVWDHDRQKWLLEDDKLDQSQTNTRENTIIGLCADDDRFIEVNTSNSCTCNNWVGDIGVNIKQSIETCSKLRGILTRPRLFRSTLNYSASGNKDISDSDNDGKTRENKAKDRLNESISSKGTSSAYLGNDYDNDSIDAKTAQQIVRNACVTYFPFMNLNRDNTPQPADLNINQLVRNTQINSLRCLKEVANNETFLAALNMRNSDISRGSRSMNIYQYDTNNHTPKQTLESTVHSKFGNNSDNDNQTSRQFPTNGADYVLRPVSEIMPLTEAYKANIGTSTAVRSKDITHSMDKQVFEPQKAMLEKSQMPKITTNINQANEKGKAQNDSQRNGLFTSSPPQGGRYSYSIQHTSGATKSNRGKHIFDFDTAKRANKLFEGGLAVHNFHSFANINDLSFNLRNSTGYKTKFISFRERSDTYKATDTATAQQVNYKHQSNVKGGNTKGISHVINKDAAVQIHTHDIQVKINEANNITPNAHQTADKFKCLRSRRDQEMEWLMCDAAETEV